MRLDPVNHAHKRALEGEIGVESAEQEENRTGNRMCKKAFSYSVVSFLLVSSSAFAQTNAPKKEPEIETKAATPPSLGIAPGTVTAKSTDIASATVRPAEELSTSTEEWNFRFHGYLYAPLRLGIVSDDGEDGTSLTSPPRVPDGSYNNWQYTNNIQGPWTELKFAYGNSRVSANVIIAAWNITSGGYRDLQSQLGINQSFITLNFPRLLGPRGGLLWNVGVFQNRYGAAGKYDAGKYGTYLFGETHVAGETLTAYYDVTDDWTAQLEHGFGVKIQAAPLLTGVNPVPSYLPWAGPEVQGTTLLHHLHAGASFREWLRFTGHYLTSWTDDARRAFDERDGRITVLGGEVKWAGEIYGDGFLGYSRLNTRDVNRVNEAIEVLHSQWGWNLRDNFFPNQQYGKNHIDTIAFQYTYSIATLLWYPNKFWGQGPDVTLSIFGMYNAVSGEGSYDGKDAQGNTISERRKVDTQKLKIGGEVVYTPLAWFAVGGRYDLVQPNLKDNTLSFHVLTPKIIFRTDFVSHEQVVVQYARYIYGDNVRAEFPWLGLKPARDVISVTGLMWW
jgi:hypothetical protein